MQGRGQSTVVSHCTVVWHSVTLTFTRPVSGPQPDFVNLKHVGKHINELLVKLFSQKLRLKCEKYLKLFISYILGVCSLARLFTTR